MTFKKTNISLGVALATITMAGALVSPQALARHQVQSARQKLQTEKLRYWKLNFKLCRMK